MKENQVVRTQPEIGLARTRSRVRPLGQLLLDLGLLTEQQLGQALDLQREQPEDRRQTIGSICVSLGFISRDRLNLVLDQWSKRMRLGEILVNRGRLKPWQLETVLQRQKRRGGRLGELLLAEGVIDEATLTESLAEQYDLAYVPVRDLQLTPDLASTINAQYAWANGVVPIAREGRRLTVVIQDPTRPELQQELERSTGMQVRMVLTTRSEVRDCARRLYEFREDFRAETRPPSASISDLEENLSRSELWRRALTRCVATRAREMVFDAGEPGRELRICRPDSDFPVPDFLLSGRSASSMARTIKVMAGLDPHETGRLMEGHLVAETLEGDFSRTVHARIRVEPAPGGERITVRIRDDRDGNPSFDGWNVEPEIQTEVARLLGESRGTFLVAGPAGCGKRVTLRCLLEGQIARDTVICSAEETIPWEYEGVHQYDVRDLRFHGYAGLLRAFLGERPDLIVLEQLGDSETASRAFHAWEERPLILSTLSAGNATAAVDHLLQRGVEREAIAATLAGVLAQRLLRQVCAGCESSYEPRGSVLAEWFRAEVPFTRWKRGKGCPECGGTGFGEPMLVTELWIPTAEERTAIQQGAAGSDLRTLVLERIPSLGQAALSQAIAGRTTLEEALRTVGYGDVIYTRNRGLRMAG